MMRYQFFFLDFVSWNFGREGVKESIAGSDDLIQPKRNFTYEIKLSDEIGTLWWHAKSAWASATVHGAFVILPAANEDYPFPAPTSDQTIILGIVNNLVILFYFCFILSKDYKSLTSLVYSSVRIMV